MKPDNTATLARSVCDVLRLLDCGVRWCGVQCPSREHFAKHVGPRPPTSSTILLRLSLQGEWGGIRAMYTGWLVCRVCSNLQFATSHRESIMKGTGSRRGVEYLKSLYRSWVCTFDDRTPSTQMVHDAHTPRPRTRSGRLCTSVDSSRVGPRT